MNTITKDDFLTMVKLQHLEVLSQEQLSQNTNQLKSYMEKSLTSELSDIEKSDANAMVEEVAGFACWQVMRNDFSKAIVYTRREQVTWEEAERGEFGEIIKARAGVYKPTAENKKKGIVGQKYGEKKSDWDYKDKSKVSEPTEGPTAGTGSDRKEGGEKKEKTFSGHKIGDKIKFSPATTTPTEVDATLVDIKDGVPYIEYQGKVMGTHPSRIKPKEGHKGEHQSKLTFTGILEKQGVVWIQAKDEKGGKYSAEANKDDLKKLRGREKFAETEKEKNALMSKYFPTYHYDKDIKGGEKKENWHSSGFMVPPGRKSEQLPNKEEKFGKYDYKGFKAAVGVKDEKKVKELWDDFKNFKLGKDSEESERFEIWMRQQKELK